MWKTAILAAGLVLAAMPSWGQSRSQYDDDDERGSRTEWRRDPDRCDPSCTSMNLDVRSSKIS